MKKKNEERCCGGCCWFVCEDINGYGYCMDAALPFTGKVRCSKKACSESISREQMRHYMAVLVQHNRWRRSQEVPNHCRMVNPKEIGRAIDFAVKYIKTFSKL